MCTFLNRKKKATGELRRSVLYLLTQNHLNLIKSPQEEKSTIIVLQK